MLRHQTQQGDNKVQDLIPSWSSTQNKTRQDTRECDNQRKHFTQKPTKIDILLVIFFGTY